MPDIAIKVQTEKLISAAGEVETNIRRLEQAFQNIEQIIDASRYYWQGEGASSHVNAYRTKMDVVQIALRRFRENVTDLQVIAGVYEKTEAEVLTDSQALDTDIIV